MNIVVNYKLTSTKALPDFTEMLKHADVNIFDFRIAKLPLSLPEKVSVFNFRPDEADNYEYIILNEMANKQYKSVVILDSSGLDSKFVVDIDFSEFNLSVFDDENIGIAYCDYVISFKDGVEMTVMLQSPPVENVPIPLFFINGHQSILASGKTLRSIFRDYPSKHIPKFLCRLNEI